MGFKKPKIPALSSKTPPDIRRAITSIVEYMSGMAGYQDQVDKLVRAVSDSVQDETIYPTQPAPTGLVVNGAFNTIILKWDQSDTRGFSHTEVWRNTEDNLSTAEMVGTTNAMVYSDAPPDSRLSVTYYYWIRYVNQGGNPGPFNDTAGTPGSTADDPAYVLEVLTDEITEGQLYQDLNTRIDKIEVTETALQTETVIRQSEDSALASQVTTLSAVTENNRVALQTKAEVTDLNAVYEVKTDINGRVTGFGMVANASSTEFGINADRFWVADPDNSANVKIPFVIDDGKVVMDTALIENGTITNAKIASLAADKLYASSGTIASAVIGTGHITNAMVGTLAADKLYASSGTIASAIIGTEHVTNSMVKNAAITNAKIDDAAITNAKIDNAAVDTLQLAGESVTVPRSFFSAARVYDGAYPYNPVGYLDVAVITTTFPAGTKAAFMVSFTAETSLNQGDPIEVKVFRGSSVIHSIKIPIAYGTSQVDSGDSSVAISFNFSDTVYAGTATYKVRLYWFGGSVVSERSLIILGLQR